MTDSNSRKSGSRSINDVFNDHYPNHEPVVRYAVPNDEGVPMQQSMLHYIKDPIPERANWASAVYFISENQEERLQEYAENPYGNPSSDNIAKTIQDECEDTERVLYAVHAESDEHENDEKENGSGLVPLPTMVGWLQEWVRTVIDEDPGNCTFFYSGNRSIHVHTPYFLTGANLRWIKQQTKQYCSNSVAVLDPSVYKRKQQFRIPGVLHQKRGLRKVQIDTSWEHVDIISASANDVDQPDTYADVLEMLFRPDVSTDLSDLLVSSSIEETQSSSPLTEWPSRYKRPHDEHKNRAYTGYSFYPYPTGNDHNGRSVASVRMIDGSFQRQEAGKNRTFIPCYFYGAHSCSGRAYTKNEHYAPLQLSAKDAKKWDYEEGDPIIIIGGGNFESIIHPVTETIAQHVGDLLDPTDGNREDALEYLETKGYDVGSAGPSQGTHTATTQQPSDSDDESKQSTSITDAARLQRRAEKESVEMSLEHDERRKVANRLLTIHGWDHAWNWFREQYGNDFDPQRTWQGFRSIIQTHSDDFTHIEVPPKS